MKFFYLFTLLFALLMSACKPTQKITNSWINPDAGSKGPYTSIFVIVLSQSKETSFSVEDRMAEIITSRGQKAVISSSVFPPNMSISENFTEEQMSAAIKKTGCDAVFLIALLDIKKLKLPINPAGLIIP